MTEQTPKGARLSTSYQQRLLIEMRVNSQRPSTAAAFLLCLFLGGFGAHRVYLGERGTGLVMLVLGITVIGLPVTLVWAIVDLFLIPGIIRRRTEETRARLMAEALAEAAG
jgi:TM2 domain-containing membrane protein YozV